MITNHGLLTSRTSLAKEVSLHFEDGVDKRTVLVLIYSKRNTERDMTEQYVCGYYTTSSRGKLTKERKVFSFKEWYFSFKKGGQRNCYIDG